MASLQSYNRKYIDTGHYTDAGRGVRQVGPGKNYNAKLPYDRAVDSFSGDSTRYWGHYDNINDARGYSGPSYAQAYDRLISTAKGGKRASAGITLVQWRQSLEMIAGRGGQLVSLIKKVDKRARRKRESFSGAWLEWNFGWLPLFGDIYQMIDVLQQTPQQGNATGNGMEAFQGNETITWSGPAGGSSSKSYVRQKKIRLAADIRVTNPNLLLANQLGLTNPLAIAWDAVPYSFVVDWFLPVNKFLGSFDSKVGIDLSGGYGSYKLTSSSERYMRYNRPEYADYNASGWGHGSEFNRRVIPLDLPSFGDRVLPLSGSLWRAVTSVALASQMLSSRR